MADMVNKKLSTEQLARLISDRLIAGYWGDIEPCLFEYVAEETEDLCEDTRESVEALRALLDDVVKEIQKMDG